MNDFQVTLPSHGNTQEFPHNRPNHFKNRLPYPLQLNGGGWKVGLSSISLPDSKVNIYHLVGKDEYILNTSWIKYVPKEGRSDMIDKQGSASCLVNDLKDLHSIVDGVSFMKATINSLEQQRLENEVGPVPGSKFVNDRGKHTYVMFRWEGEDLRIDNTQVLHGGFSKTPRLGIHQGLAVKMGWLEQIGEDQFSLGPNLKQGFLNDKVSDLKNRPAWLDLEDGEGHPVFWRVVAGYFILGMTCNWYFVNLNNAFRTVVGNASRTLHVYSDVGGNNIVANQVTDLLREVQYERKGRGNTYFEPLHVQYLSVRNEFIDIIESQVAETSGNLVNFGEGNTILTLQLQKGIKRPRTLFLSTHQQNMHGGGLTRFRPDNQQLGNGFLLDVAKSGLRGGLEGLKSTRRFRDIKKNTLSGVKRGVKRKIGEELRKSDN